jgi:hypothetical protein
MQHRHKRELPTVWMLWRAHSTSLASPFDY